MFGFKKGYLIQLVSSVLANLMVFNYGMQTGWMSPSINVLQSQESPSGYPLSDYEISMVASILCVFGVLVSVPYCYFADRFGRKKTLILVAVPQVLTWVLKLISAHPYCLLVARALAGVAAGGCFSVVPLFTKEITEDALRGLLGSLGMLLQSLGTVFMFAMGAYLEYYTVIWISLWFPLTNLVLLLLVPESPSYLVKVGRIEEATKVIAYLRGIDKKNEIVQMEIKTIQCELARFENAKSVTFKAIFADKASRRALWIALQLIIALDAGGNYAIVSYASVIVKESGVTVGPEVQAMAIPILMMLGAILSMTIVEKFGRKPLILTCLVFTAIPMAVLASVLLGIHHGVAVPGWLSITSIVSSVFCYGAGILPVPYIVMSEIFNFQIRAKVLGYIVTIGWFLVFLQLIAFAPITQILGMYTMFYIFAALNALFALTLYFNMPETKGKSIQEIENELRGEPFDDYKS